MVLLRLLAGFAGIIVAILGFMSVTLAWMNGAKADFSSWAVFTIGAVMWLQALPLMRAAEREERRKQIRELLKSKE